MLPSLDEWPRAAGRFNGHMMKDELYETLLPAVVLTLLSLWSCPVGANIFDISALSYQTVVVKAGHSVNLTCPGVSELSLISALEWRCQGCNLPASTSSSSSSSSSLASANGTRSSAGSHGETSAVKLVEYSNNAVVVWNNQERMSLDSQTYALLFFPVRHYDHGEYTCLVNERRRPDTIIHLVVQDVPDPPGRPLIMGFTSRSVNLSWAPSLSSHGSPISHYIIHTRVGEEGDWDVQNALVTLTNATSSQVIGLLPYTVYSFRVVAINALGPSTPSRESYYMVTLREVPDGKPQVMSAHNSSSTSIYLNWKPPPKSSIHGEFLGYRLAYKERDDTSSESVQEIFLRDPNIESHAIQGLQTFTQYMISLQVFNPEGLGPSSTVIVMTDEGVPGKPLNVSIGDVNDSTIALSWSEPENPNGVIKGYRIYFMRKNFTDVQTVRNGEKFQKFVLTDLEPYMEYKLWLKAFTWKHEGEPSEPIVVQTDVRGPSAPRIANLTCHNADTLFLQWHRPSIYNKSIDLYYIYYRREDAWDFEELAVATTTDRLDHMMFLPNLTTNVMYEVKIRGATRSLFSPSKIYPGLFSESRKIFVALDCDRLSLSHVQSGSEIYGQEIELSAGMVAAMVCASFALLLVILAFVLWRKYFQAAYYYLDDGPPTTPPLNQPAWDGGEPPTHNNMTIIVDDDSDFAESKNKEFGVNAKGPIPVPLFPQHVATLHADGDIGFSKEYEAIQSVSIQGELNSEHSMNEDNKNKNRYLNIVAYDHSRVQLRPLPGQKKSTDYINANYIDGFQQCRGYIGTQGPLPSTFDAFWRMIWEQRVAVIVMITNLVERGRRKCDMYWPKEGVETHGVIQVKLVNEDARATYTIRTFSIRHLKLKKKKSQNAERIVLQFHYTNWPDHGTPEHPLPILSFVRQSAAANPIGAGPIIVHCSAGVGRTGTYIVLDAMLKQIECKNELNIRGFLCHIRNQRNFLVQTEEQYIFIHDALLEAIQAGNTNVHSSQLTRYLQLLQSGLPASLLSDKIIGSNSTASTLDTTTTTMTMNSIGSQEDLWLLLDHQFHLVTNFLVQDFHLSSAVKNCNVHKNRNAALVSVESARVYLTPKPGVEGSDYINATWLQGYQKLKEFIVTQHPLEATVSDFWQMVWDHNSQTVVVLSDTTDDDYQVFWPLKQVDVEFENFRVRFIDEHKIQLPAVGNHPAHPDEYVTQIEVAAQSLQDDYELRVRIFYCPSWPYRGAANPDLAALFRLPKLVIDSHQQYQNGPVVVVDRFGGTEAATLCALTTLMQQLSRDQHVDVYMYAKLYHSKRPNVWPSRDDYMFLYRCVEALHHHLPVPPSTPPTLHTSFSLPLQLNGYAGGGIGDTVSLTSLPPLCTTPSATSPNGDVVCFRIPPDGMEQEMVDVV